MIKFIPHLILPIKLKSWLKMYSPFNESSNRFFFELTRSIIKQRLKSTDKYNDFIQSLINAKNKEVDDLDELDLAGTKNPLMFQLKLGET